MMRRLGNVSGVQQIVIRVAVLAVALLQPQQEVIQRLRTDLQRAIHHLYFRFVILEVEWNR